MSAPELADVLPDRPRRAGFDTPENERRSTKRAQPAQAGSPPARTRRGSRGGWLVLVLLLALAGGYFGLSKLWAWPTERFSNPVRGSVHLRPLAAPPVFGRGPVACFEIALPGPHYELYVAGNALAERPQFSVLNGQPVFAWSEPRPHRLRVSFGLQGQASVSDEGLEPFCRERVEATELWPSAYAGPRLLMVREWTLQRRLFGPPALPVVDVFHASGHSAVPLSWFARDLQDLRRLPDNQQPFRLTGRPHALFAKSEAALQVLPDNRALLLATWVWAPEEESIELIQDAGGAVRVLSEEDNLALEDCELPWLQVGLRSQRAVEQERQEELRSLWTGLEAGQPRALDRLLQTRDPTLIARVASRLPGAFAGQNLSVRQLELLQLAGPEALPIIVRQLCRGGLPGLPFSRVSDSERGAQAFRAWPSADYPRGLRDWLLAHDPGLRQIWDGLRAEPDSHPSLLLDLAHELARQHGRSQVLARLARLLADTRPAGGRTSFHIGSQLSDYTPRFCDKAVLLLAELAGWTLELEPHLELPGQSLDWSQPEYWDFQRERAGALWQLSDLQPAGWIGVQASSLAPHSSWSAELNEGGGWRPVTGRRDSSPLTQVLGPLPAGEVQLRVVHASALGERVVGPVQRVTVAADSTVACPVTLPAVPGPGSGWLWLRPAPAADSVWQVELRSSEHAWSWWLRRRELLIGPLTADSYQLRAGASLAGQDPRRLQLVAGETLEVRLPVAADEGQPDSPPKR